MGKVIGIDLAPDMLARARRKIAENGWNHLSVLEMDALHPDFPDDSFDYVMAFHVVTVVPDPARMINEAKRVCRPAGRIVVVNHFTSESRIRGFLTESLDPLTRRLGWRTNLRLKPFIAAAELNTEAIYKLSKLSELLQTPHRKRETEEHGGPITRTYLRYAIGDPQTTYECFEVESRLLDDMKQRKQFDFLMSQWHPTLRMMLRGVAQN